MAERCYKDPYLLSSGTTTRVFNHILTKNPKFSDTSALTTTLEFAKNPYGLPRGSGAPLGGVSDPGRCGSSPRKRKLPGKYHML